MILNRRMVECDFEKLPALLADQITEADSQVLLAHIERCANCRQKLADLSGAPTLWESVREVLTGSDRSNSDAPVSEKMGQVVDTDQDRLISPEAKSVSRILLGEPRNPGMVGSIGRYDVERLIGSGGMGVVFKGFDADLNRPVAIKVLAPSLAFSGSARQRFAREGKAAAAVVHEHVVPIYNVESNAEFPFLVMHYAQGDSLQSRIDKYGPLGLDEILRIAMQVASGLAAAHAHGLVHRDVKPANVLLENGIERALITDFGLAQAKDDASLTYSGFLAGTPQYMSPEQARGDKVNALSDLFSLGSVLYAMCTGRPPFRGESSLAVLQQIPTNTAKPIREINPAIPEWLCRIVQRLMMKDPRQRYQSATEVAELIGQCLAHIQQPLEVDLPTTLRSVPSAFRLRLTRRKLSLFLLLGMLILITGGVLAQGRFFASSDPVGTRRNATLEHQAQSLGGLANEDVNQQENNDASTIIRWNGAPVPLTEIDKRRGELDQIIAVNWESKPLKSAIAELCESIDIDVEFATDVDANSPSFSSDAITLRANLSPAQVFQRVLPRHDLGYIVNAAGIVIAPLDYIDRNPKLTRYDLSYITDNSTQAASVLELILQTIEPHQWNSQGGSCSLALTGPVLHVRATEAMHLQIRRLLSMLVRNPMTP